MILKKGGAILLYRDFFEDELAITKEEEKREFFHSERETQAEKKRR